MFVLYAFERKGDWSVKVPEVSSDWLEVDTVNDIDWYDNLEMDDELSRYIDSQ